MKIPYKRTFTAQAAALGTNVDGKTILGKAPFAGSVVAASFIPNAAITGVDTNTRRIAVENAGSNGAGTTEAAALQFNAAVNAVAFDEKSLTLAATAANRDFAEGDILVINSTSPGTGLADPGGLYVVELSRTTGT